MGPYWFMIEEWGLHWFWYFYFWKELGLGVCVGFGLFSATLCSTIIVKIHKISHITNPKVPPLISILFVNFLINFISSKLFGVYGVFLLSVMLFEFFMALCEFPIECGVWEERKLIENFFASFGFAMVSAMG